MDARDDVDRPQGQDGAPGPDAEPTGAPHAPGWYRRPWGIAAIAAAGVLAVGGIAVGAMALADADDDAPPVAESASPTGTQSAEPSATETPSPTPTPSETTPPAEEPEPEAPAVPGLEACGTAAPAATDGGGLWVGDYGGGVDGDVNVPLDLRWAMISGEDWGGQTVTATVLGLWLVAQDGTVVAVPADGTPGPLAVAMTSGSEGDGGGSEGALVVTTDFRACPGGTGGLPAAEYRARIGVSVSAGGAAQTVWGDIPFFLPDYDTAAGA